MTHQQAIAALASLEQLDLNPAQPGLTSTPETPAEEMLRLAGPEVIPLIEAALPSASGTGRVALLRIMIELDRARAVPLVASHVDDKTPAVVNTCLVGFRSVAQWSADTLCWLDPVHPRAQRIAAEANAAFERWKRRRMALRVLPLVLVVLLFVWLHLAADRPH